MSARKKSRARDWSVPLDLEQLEILAGALRFSGEDPVEILRLALDKMTTRKRRAIASLDILLESHRERRRERDEPHLTVKERATRAARGPMNEAHRKALRRTLDELGWTANTTGAAAPIVRRVAVVLPPRRRTVGHKTMSHSKKTQKP